MAVTGLCSATCTDGKRLSKPGLLVERLVASYINVCRDPDEDEIGANKFELFIVLACLLSIQTVIGFVVCS